MGYFLSSLTNLEGALASGLPGDSAMSFLSDLQAEQQERRDARMEARTLRQQMRRGNKMQNILLASQQMGLPVPEITTEANKISELTGVAPSPRFLANLVQGWPQEQTMPQFDTSPMLDVPTRQAIQADVMEGLQAGKPINQIRNEIHMEMKALDAMGYDDIADSVDLLIQRALGG